jgi:hypothetical protein
MSRDTPTHPVDLKTSRPTWLGWCVAIAVMMVILAALYWMKSNDFSQ